MHIHVYICIYALTFYTYINLDSNLVAGVFLFTLHILLDIVGIIWPDKYVY